ncbi:MAG TPA: T9SS type A sorting domain-containing protein, partial [Chitinophagaceae bacterium]|nr:T9SS type A sorting domain-containing protein [Chitinophagaceae bacterium]
FSANNAIAFAMYPNPASTTLHLTISGAENKAMNIRITDMNGRQVYAEKISNTADVFNHDINLSSLQKGTYIIEIISAKGNSKANFVKE